MNRRAKELYQQLEKATSIDEKVVIYRNLTFEFLNNDINRCEDIVNEMMDMANEHDHLLGKIEATNALGRLSFKRGQPNNALGYFKQALSKSDPEVHTLTYAHTLIAIGMTYFNISDLKQAQHYYEQALALAETMEGHENLVASCLDHLGNIHLYHGELDQGAIYFEQAVNILEQHPQNKGALASAKGGLSFALVQKKQYPEAIEVLKDALKDFRSIEHRIGEAQTLMNIGHCAVKIGDHGEALKYLQQAQKLSKILKNNNITAQLHNGFGELYLALGGYNEALKHLNKAEMLNQVLQKPDLLCNTWSIEAEVLHRQNKTAEAEELIIRLRAFAEEHGLKEYLNWTLSSEQH